MTDTVTEADLVASLVQSCDGVAALSPAAHTYLPGRTVPGVRIGEGEIDVHVIVFFGAPIADLADRISARLASGLGRPPAGPTGGRSVTVHVEDIVMPGEDIALPGQAAAADDPPAGSTRP